ncbi:MAG: DNA-binding response regulator [Flavobacteriales bacterium]|nr:MAG: DNA-binding response regulator [Flavobacteriales bacterium]
MSLKYSIIDTEKTTTKQIHNFFKNNTGYTCVGITKGYEPSLDTILKYVPQVIFINIDPTHNNYTAFNFVNELYKYLEKMPQCIAVSKGKEQAYTCLKNGFFDYLLTPISDFELRKTEARLNKLPKPETSTLCLKSYKDYRYIDIDKILYLKADNTSTDFFLSDGSTISAYKTLKFFEQILPKNFIRIHNSYIVNKFYVSRIHFGKAKCSLKQYRLVLPFSKTYKKNVVILEKSLSKNALLSLN